MGGKDCDEYICSNDKDEQNLKEVLSGPVRTSDKSLARSYA